MTQPLNPIVESFINNGCRHMSDIPGNRVFVTDVSASTLVWHHDNIVIEYYLMYPNMVTELHSHPFDNQVIFLHGQLYGCRRDPKIGQIIEYGLFEKLEGPPRVMPITPMGIEHGFTSGPMGAVLYNVQIWPNHVTDPLSAALNINGNFSLGPIHTEVLRSLGRTVNE